MRAPFLAMEQPRVLLVLLLAAFPRRSLIIQRFLAVSVYEPLVSTELLLLLKLRLTTVLVRRQSRVSVLAKDALAESDATQACHSP